MTRARVAYVVFALGCASAYAQERGPSFAPEQIRKGAAIFEQNCAACHGARMLDPKAAFDLRAYPRDQKARFVTAVAKGTSAMPPWGDLLGAADIDALWAYVIAGEKP